MTQIKIKTLGGLRKQLGEIAEMIACPTRPISWKKEENLFAQLDQVQRSVEMLQTEVSGLFVKDLLEQITKLYGDVHNRAVVTQVNKTLQNAYHLQKAFDHGIDIKDGVCQLQNQLNNIQHNYALGQAQHKVVRYLSAQAQHYLDPSSLSKETKTFCNQMNILKIRNIQDSYCLANGELDGELGEELFQIAEAYFFKENKGLTQRYNLLPEKAKRRIKFHLKQLGSFALDDDLVKSCQALIAAAYDFSLGTHENALETYLSEAELKELFENHWDN